MEEYHIKEHPILANPERRSIEFYWRDQKFNTFDGETRASALFANGIGIFGHQPKDGSPQGIFCANGQCAQCMVFVREIPVKFCMELIEPEMRITPVGGLPVVLDSPSSDRMQVIHGKSPTEYTRKIARNYIRNELPGPPLHGYNLPIENAMIVCRCERVTAGEIRNLIAQGYQDINEIKTVTRASMGVCGSKTCNSLIQWLFREEGISLDEVVDQTKRPQFIEVPLGVFAGVKSQREPRNE